MKTRQFIVLCCLIIAGFIFVSFQNLLLYNWLDKVVETEARANNHEHQLIMKKLGN